MRKSSFAQLFLKLKPLIAESRQLLRKPDLIVEYKAHHRPTATLGPHRLHLQFVIFAYIKQRLDDSNLLLHPLPVEQMLIFLPSSAFTCWISTSVSFDFQKRFTGSFPVSGSRTQCSMR